jgi:hypothetical protein
VCLWVGDAGRRVVVVVVVVVVIVAAAAACVWRVSCVSRGALLQASVHSFVNTQLAYFVALLVAMCLFGTVSWYAQLAFMADQGTDFWCVSCPLTEKALNRPLVVHVYCIVCMRACLRTRVRAVATTTGALLSHKHHA